MSRRLWTVGRGWRTPGRLVAAGAVAIVVLFAPFAALAVGTGRADTALRVIGRDAGPQVLATADLYFALSDADAQVANLLAMGGERDQARAATLARYEQRRVEIGAALLQAHRLAGDSSAEQRTIASILDGYLRFERLAGRALLLAEQAGYPSGVPPPRVLAVYREATDLMSYQVLPQAYNLTLENGTTVRRTHDDARAAILAARVAVAAGGAAAVGCLVWLQLYLARRFRRLVNPALLAATVIVLVHAVTGVVVLTGQADGLRVATRDGFDPVLSLARGRAVSNSLHADQVRYLIDPQRADTYAQIYLDKAQSLVYAEAGSLDAYYAAMAGAPQAVGLLGAPAARTADGTAGDTLAAYERLQRADRDLRALVARGATGAAVESWFGPTGTAFRSYDAALVQLTGRYRAVFEGAVADGEDTMDDLWFWPAVIIMVAVALVVAGVRPRLAEYR
ncbi:hypothetical protein WEI85_16670 [Actinomycetes bacterium KLBMP 9797]